MAGVYYERKLSGGKRTKLPDGLVRRLKQLGQRSGLFTGFVPLFAGMKNNWQANTDKIMSQPLFNH